MIADALRSYFLIYYAIGLTIILVKIVNMVAAGKPGLYQPSGLRRFLPLVLIPSSSSLRPLRSSSAWENSTPIGRSSGCSASR
jgi:hypothetical protein